MNTKVNLQTILIVLLLSVLIFVSTGTHVQGQIGGDDLIFSQDQTGTEGVIEGTGVVPGGPGFIMISPFDFKPLYYHEDDAWSYEFSGHWGVFNPSETDQSWLVAGVTLPHNATITKLTIYYKDSDTTKDFFIGLNRSYIVGDVFSVATLQTSGEATAFRTLSTTEITDRVVDNQNNSYFLSVWFPAGASDSIMLTNVRIDYGYTVYTPTIMK